MSAFPNVKAESNARGVLGVLHRVDISDRIGRINLLVQSRERPDWSHLPGRYLLDTGGHPANPAAKDITGAYEQVSRDMHLVFRLRANPTKRVNSRSTTERSGAQGKRVDLRTEEEQLAWLSRKAEQGGFEVMSVRAHPGVPDARVMPGGRIYGRRGAAGDGRMTFGSVLFEGQLRVVDPDRFRETLASGIGSGKSYGFGLLSVAPPRAIEG